MSNTVSSVHPYFDNHSVSIFLTHIRLSCLRHQGQAVFRANETWQSLVDDWSGRRAPKVHLKGIMCDRSQPAQSSSTSQPTQHPQYSGFFCVGERRALHQLSFLHTLFIMQFWIKRKVTEKYQSNSTGPSSVRIAVL